MRGSVVCWKGSLRFGMRTRGVQMQNRIEGEQVRAAYCGQLYASVVLGHRDRMEVRVWQNLWVGKTFGAHEHQEARLTLVFTLLLQHCLKHYFW